MVLRSFALAACLVASADVWVDPINGNDSNGGARASDAWRTVSHALVQLGPTAGAEVDIVHVLPGQYSLAGGEAFPLILRDRIRLQGEGHAGLILFRGQINIGEGQASTGWETGLSNLTLYGAGTGVFMGPQGGNGAVRRASLSGLTFRDKNIAVSARSLEPTDGRSGLRIENCTFDNPQRALPLRYPFRGGQSALIASGGGSWTILAPRYA